MKKYRVKSIEEPDFGCEGRPEGYEPMDRVILEMEDGQNRVVMQKDEDLYRWDIREGDLVLLENGRLKKTETDK